MKERFTDNGDDTVTDNQTGLMWTKTANLCGRRTWNDAVFFCENLFSSGHTDWRLPSVPELFSLIDYSQYNPVLPSDHPFTGVQSDRYWTGTTYASITDFAWCVSMGVGDVYYDTKTTAYYVWPVRGGEGANEHSE